MALFDYFKKIGFGLSEDKKNSHFLNDNIL
jgi:hypothetical protein